MSRDLVEGADVGREGSWVRGFVFVRCSGGSGRSFNMGIVVFIYGNF